MKKILLIIAITFCIFQMVVLATSIDIGSPATTRGSTESGGKTMVVKDNPANASGTITSVEIYAGSSLGSCEVATFYVVSGNNLSTRDTHTIGSVTGGSKQTFEVDLDVEEGDYIGMYYAFGTLYRDTSGYVGRWHSSGDKIPCADLTFSYYANWTISLYGTGATTAEEDNAIFFGNNF